MEYIKTLQKDFAKALYSWYECIKINYGNDTTDIHYKELNEILEKYNLKIEDLEG